MQDYYDLIAWSMDQEDAPTGEISMRDLSERLAKCMPKTGDATAHVDSQYPGKWVAVTKSTLYRKFKTVDGAMERTLQSLRERHLDVPPAPANYVSSHMKTTSRDLHTRVWNFDVSVAQLGRSLELARTNADSASEVILATHLCWKILGTARTDQELAEGFQVAERGYRVAEEMPVQSRTHRIRHEQMLCARSAAWAAVQRSRLSIEVSSTRGALDQHARGASDRYLVEVTTWKNRESELAAALKLPVTAAVARFHADRASALYRNHQVDSIVNLRDIAKFLIAKKGGHGADANDRVRYHDLTSIIQRLCAVDWAYASHPLHPSHRAHRALMKKYFSDGIPALVKQLRELYDKKEERGARARGDVDVLLRIKKTNDKLLGAYEGASDPAGAAIRVDGQHLTIPDVAKLRGIIGGLRAWHFLRIREHKALHALAFARYAVAVHDIDVQVGYADKSFPVGRDELLTAAYDFCNLALNVTRRKAVDELLLERVESAQESIADRLSPSRRREVRAERSGRDKDGFRDEVDDALNSLVWRAVTGNRLEKKAAEAIADDARTIGLYLMESRSEIRSGGIEPDLA